MEKKTQGITGKGDWMGHWSHLRLRSVSWWMLLHLLVGTLMESRCVVPSALCILLQLRPVCHVPPKIKIRFRPNIHTTNQGAALMMSCSVSEGVYLMPRPVSSTYKYADRIMDYAKPAGLLGGHKTCSTFHFLFSCSASSAACFSHHSPGLSLFNTLMWYHVVPFRAHLLQHHSRCSADLGVTDTVFTNVGEPKMIIHLLLLPNCSPSTGCCFCICRFWIWELLPAGGASGHVVWQPTLCCSRGLRGSTVWGPTARYLGKKSSAWQENDSVCTENCTWIISFRVQWVFDLSFVFYHGNERCRPYVLAAVISRSQVGDYNFTPLISHFPQKWKHVVKCLMSSFWATFEIMSGNMVCPWKRSHTDDRF